MQNQAVTEDTETYTLFIVCLKWIELFTVHRAIRKEQISLMAKIKQGKSQKKRPLKKGELPSVQEVIPIKRMDQNDVVKNDDSFFAFLKISTQDINGLSAEEQQQAQSQLENLSRIYDDDMSILSMMFPTNIDSNLVFWNKKLMQARNRQNMAQLMICREQIQRLLWVEMELSNLEFYCMVYGKTKKEIVLAKMLLKRSGGSLLRIKDVNAGQTEKILTKLFNMNTAI